MENVLETVKIEDLTWTGKTAGALTRAAGIKTLGDLANKKDEELLEIPRVGVKALAEIRENIARALGKPVPERLTEERKVRKTKNAQQTVQSFNEDALVNWAKNHSSTIIAIMKGEMVLIPRQ